MTSNGTTALAKAPNGNTGTELAQFGEMSVNAIIDRKAKIAKVMDAVMKPGEHYGKIPGCGDKPSLFKAGAEILATVFGMAPQLEIKRTDLSNGHREYEVKCTLVHIATGAIVGEGVGTCSTMESKYRWRKGERKCPQCGKSTIIKGQAQYGGGWVCWDKKGGCKSKWPDGAKEIEEQNVDRVENPDVADVYNTVLKMAKKRAQVDCTLTAVGASDILTQDLEDLAASARDYPAAAASTNDDLGAPPPDTRSTAHAAAPAEDPQLEDRALDLIADIGDTRTADELKALIKRCNDIPRNTRARQSVRDAYDKQMALVSGAAS